MLMLSRRVIARLRDERGTETLEWGLICGLVVVGAIMAIVMIGPKVSDMWSNVDNAIPAGASP